MSNRFTLNDAQIVQILTRLVEVGETLKNPNISKQIRADVLTLPDDVKAMHETAQETIAQAAGISASLKKQEDEANERLKQRERSIEVREQEIKQLKSLKAEAEVIAATNKESSAALDKRITVLNTITAQHEATTRKHAETLTEISRQQKALATENEKLEAKRKEIAAYEADVNETAEQMSNFTKKKLRK